VKINQEYQFRPITITLEHKWEAITLWDAIDRFKVDPSTDEGKFLIALSNWFSTQAEI
jgi:hypothetical protein